MHYNKHSNDLTENEISCQQFVDHNSLTRARRKLEAESVGLPALSVEIKEEEEEQCKTLDAGKTFRATKTATNSTVSADSGVNTSDDDISPSLPKYSQSHSLATDSTASHCCEKLHNQNKNTNRDNYVNNEGNNCENVINNTNKSNFNYINNVDHDDENKNINSQNFNNKFKGTDSSKEVNSTRYQQQTHNLSRSASVVDICQEKSLETVKPTSDSTTAPTSKPFNDKSSLRHDAFIHLQERVPSPSPSPTSSPSMSSTANSYDNNLPSKSTQHWKGSPVVSIRSINSTIITSDSDSDLNSDGENYVIKKLGTQVTYSPNDPAIPNIRNGHVVMNQKVIANSNQQPPLPPLQALAVIGGQIGAAQALGPVPSTSDVNQRPQIGSVALSNSSDVTFGDKHFYEGPVTIQQFLIDGRDKWKEANENENNSFRNENEKSSANNAKDTVSEAEKSCSVYGYIWKRKRTIIPGALAFTTLLIGASIWGSRMLAESKSKLVLGNNEESRYLIPIASTIDPNFSNNSTDCEGNGTLCLIDRDVWRAHPQTGVLDKQKLPLHRVVISHTASEPCDSIQICTGRVRVIQEFHMNSLGWDDIAYNFLISSDGRVYVGRGWDYVGAHTKGYNYDSVGITFIGTYISVEPTEVQLNACLSLLEEGVRLKKLTPDYRLYGARQLGATESPAQDNIGGGYVFRMVPRAAWLAQPPVNPWTKLTLPVDRVIVIPTRTSECETQAACTYTVRITQTYNIESQQQDDIIYNFLVGGDGNVYEGRGWDNKGSVIKGFNDDSISVAFIGSFKKQQPSYKQLNVTKLLLEEGVRFKKLSSNYKIIGANKLDSTSVATSADALYESFKNWPHWSDK